MVIDKIVDSGLIEENQVIVLGLSGGPDSLCLLHALVQIQEHYNLTIVPVHVNHKLRPTADEEAENVARICEILDLECLIFEADCEGMANDLGISTEEAGRYIRYEIFDDVANDLKMQIQEQDSDEERIVIAVAHNADDQSETVLFRLLRGTGVHGLAGIPEVRPSEEGFLIIRPLLKVTRDEIEAYIKENNLRPNIDESNEGNDYTRNRIRNELIPYLEKNYNPNIKDALRRFAEIADVDDSLMEDIAYGECDGNLEANDEEETLTLDITEIKDNPPAVNRRIVAVILKSLRLDTKSSYELVISIMNLIYGSNPSATINLPNGYKAIREYDKIVFTDNEDYMKKAMPSDMLRLVTQVVPKKEFLMPEGNYAAFDFDKFNEEYPGRAGEIVLRTRQEGDYIAINAPSRSDLKGAKKIQDLFTDCKVKKNERDAVMMACIGSEVLWVLPNDCFGSEELKNKGKFSQKFHITDTTERVLFLEVEADL